MSRGPPCGHTPRLAQEANKASTASETMRRYDIKLIKRWSIVYSIPFKGLKIHIPVVVNTLSIGVVVAGFGHAI